MGFEVPQHFRVMSSPSMFLSSLRSGALFCSSRSCPLAWYASHLWGCAASFLLNLTRSCAPDLPCCDPSEQLSRWFFAMMFFVTGWQVCSPSCTRCCLHCFCETCKLFFVFLGLSGSVLGFLPCSSSGQDPVLPCLGHGRPVSRPETLLSAVYCHRKIVTCSGIEPRLCAPCWLRGRSPHLFHPSVSLPPSPDFSPPALPWMTTGFPPWVLRFAFPSLGTLLVADQLPSWVVRAVSDVSIPGSPVPSMLLAHLWFPSMGRLEQVLVHALFFYDSDFRSSLSVPFPRFLDLLVVCLCDYCLLPSFVDAFLGERPAQILGPPGCLSREHTAVRAHDVCKFTFSVNGARHADLSHNLLYGF